MRENLRVKICGITKPEQGAAIAELGATALGFICVASSPRYVSPLQICRIVGALTDYPQVDRIGVFVNATIADIATMVTATGLTGVQLHGTESPVFCQDLRQQLPGIELIKAIRVKQSADLSLALTYATYVDTLLLDAYDPGQWGGTGHTLDWQTLQTFAPPCPWLLAGGLTPGNVGIALGQLRPQGIDLSSGVEVAPGDKNLHRIADLFTQLAHLTQGNSVGESVVSKA